MILVSNQHFQAKESILKWIKFNIAFSLQPIGGRLQNTADEEPRRREEETRRRPEVGRGTQTDHATTTSAHRRVDERAHSGRPAPCHGVVSDVTEHCGDRGLETPVTQGRRASRDVLRSVNITSYYHCTVDIFVYICINC